MFKKKEPIKTEPVVVPEPVLEPVTPDEIKNALLILKRAEKHEQFFKGENYRNFRIKYDRESDLMRYYGNYGYRMGIGDYSPDAMIDQLLNYDFRTVETIKQEKLDKLAAEMKTVSSRLDALAEEAKKLK